MNLLAQILSSKVRAEIFRILFGLVDDPRHMREIERRSGFALGTVQQELKKISALDLVIKRRDGNRVYYQARKDHPLYPEIHNLVLKTNGMADLFREVLDKEPQIKTAFAFGSIASHTEKAASDVDLMVIGTISLRKMTQLLMGLSEKIGWEINPHVLSPEEFFRRKSHKDHFITQLMESSKIFILGNEDDLKSMG
ncbi:MAG: toxin-antitoxin system toxin subunit [Deltaproteobacteria bacterium RBG_13_43_22]|nr:MAG: toxin-antitoxin system toxin subunit [Deltaproteobacteria bacterium RBG_13_43_22]